MRVASRTERELVLEHRPRGVPLLAGGLVGVVAVGMAVSRDSLTWEDWVGAGAGLAVGVFITYLTALPSRWVFDAERGEARWKHTGWPGRSEGSCRLADIHSVLVGGDSADPGAEWILLRTAQGTIPLTRHLSAFEPHEQIADELRGWLAAATD